VNLTSAAPVARWVRTRHWQVWAAAGAVFVLFAVLGAVTRTPATAPVPDAPGLADGVERGGAAPPAAPIAVAPTAAPANAYPGVSYPRRTPGSGGTPTPSAAYFPDCAAADAAGVAPIRRGAPGYRPALDRDGDGTACDTPVPTPTTGPTTASTPTPTVSPTPTTQPTVEPTPTVTPSPTADPTTDPPVVGPPTD
jgi:Excalibur calcium-binding domain